MEMIPRRQFMQVTAVGALSTVVASNVTSASACFGTSETAGTQTVVIEGFDWGPAVTATILELPNAVRPSSVHAEDFVVNETKEAFDWVTFAPTHVTSTVARTVTDAYTCDKNGERSKLASRYIRLEMSYDPNTGAPFCYDLYTGKNTWCDPYELSVQLREGAALATVLGRKVETLTMDASIDWSAAKIPQLEGFDQTGVYNSTDGKKLTYAYYQPSTTEGQKVPLVIWLHGAGEGGEDPSIALLGNEVTALVSDEFQAAMGGSAYVLTPQTPTFWLEWDASAPDTWGQNPGVASVYTQSLKELIDAFVQAHPAIDANRIYIGGCSNGGYMTVNMVLRYPDYFAAAYPICEAYKDEGISDAELEAVKNVPLWFVYAKNDTVVDPTVYEAPTIARLRAIGANLHTSIFEDVHDTSGLYKGDDGQPYQYIGHWSWLYFFNNECKDDATGENLWTWMSQQSK